VFVVRDLASLCLYYALRLISCSVGTFLSSRFRKYNLEQVIIYSSELRIYLANKMHVPSY
jgi:hypothetical protein